jgi:hypothetical protein
MDEVHRPLVRKSRRGFAATALLNTLDHQKVTMKVRPNG